MTDDEKTAESAAGLIPEPSEGRDPIEQLRRRRFPFPDPYEGFVCTLLAEIDQVQAQLGAVVEECAAIAESEPVAHGWDGKRWWHSGEKAAAKIRSLHPSATKALARRVLDARREEAAHWHDSQELSAGCFVGTCPGCIRVAEIDAQLARLDNQKEQKP